MEQHLVLSVEFFTVDVQSLNKNLMSPYLNDLNAFFFPQSRGQQTRPEPSVHLQIDLCFFMIFIKTLFIESIL